MPACNGHVSMHIWSVRPGEAQILIDSKKPNRRIQMLASRSRYNVAQTGEQPHLSMQPLYGTDQHNGSIVAQPVKQQGSQQTPAALLDPSHSFPSFSSPEFTHCPMPRTAKQGDARLGTEKGSSFARPPPQPNWVAAKNVSKSRPPLLFHPMSLQPASSVHVLARHTRDL